MKKKLFESIGSNMFRINLSEEDRLASTDIQNAINVIKKQRYSDKAKGVEDTMRKVVAKEGDIECIIVRDDDEYVNYFVVTYKGQEIAAGFQDRDYFEVTFNPLKTPGEKYIVWKSYDHIVKYFVEKTA